MDAMAEAPATLGAAMATEPAWLKAWIGLLVVSNLAAILFVIKREGGRFCVRPEAIAILVSFFAAGRLMEVIYAEMGYVRLLGLAHLVFWGPVWGWIAFMRRARIGTTSIFARYVHVYLAVAGVSLLIDLIDVVRWALGDGQLLHRWSS